MTISHRDEFVPLGELGPDGVRSGARLRGEGGCGDGALDALLNPSRKPEPSDIRRAAQCLAFVRSVVGASADNDLREMRDRLVQAATRYVGAVVRMEANEACANFEHAGEPNAFAAAVTPLDRARNCPVTFGVNEAARGKQEGGCGRMDTSRVRNDQGPDYRAS